MIINTISGYRITIKDTEINNAINSIKSRMEGGSAMVKATYTDAAGKQHILTAKYYSEARYRNNYYNNYGQRTWCGQTPIEGTEHIAGHVRTNRETSSSIYDTPAGLRALDIASADKLSERQIVMGEIAKVIWEAKKRQVENL